MKLFKRFANQSGQGMTEYIIIVALIAIAAIAAFTYFGSAVRTQTGLMTEELAGKDKDAASALGGAVTGAEKEMSAKKGLQNYTDGASAAGK